MKVRCSLCGALVDAYVLEAHKRVLHPVGSPFNPKPSKKGKKKPWPKR